jgi:hypothetical protein
MVTFDHPFLVRNHLACLEQAVPNLTSPRVYQFPKGVGACLAGLNTLFFGGLILIESVFWLSCTCPNIDQDLPNKLKCGLIDLPT